jgi:DNA-binding CsgD family transcriptional regulator
MDTFQRAAHIAWKLGWPEGLARAALGFEEAGWRLNLLGEPAVRLLEKALRSFMEEDSALRASIMGGLARALYIVGERDCAESLSRQSVEMARRVDDPLALYTALRVSLFACQKPEDIEERLASATQMLKLAEEAGDKEMIAEARGWHLDGLLALGDIQALDRELEIYAQIAAEVRQPFYVYTLLVKKATRAILAGRFDEGERFACQALTIGQRVQAENAEGTFGVQMFTLRRGQGRLRELEPAVRSFVQQHPVTSTWRPGLALIYCELGLELEARAEFEHLAAHDFTNLPRDALWLTCIVYLAEVCAFLGDARRAAILYQLLLPYARHNVGVGPEIACYGSASRYLGLLAAAMSKWEDATKHFENALAMNAKMGAKPWVAHTQHDYAEMLLARGQPTYYEKAGSLLDEALVIARDLGMRVLEERVKAQMDQMVVAPQAAPAYPDGLSAREVEVLRLMAASKSNRDIGHALFISLSTVATHVRNILTKTGSANRTEAAAYAMRHGLMRG